MPNTIIETAPAPSPPIAAASGAAGSWAYTFNGNIYVVTGGTIRGPYPSGAT